MIFCNGCSKSGTHFLTSLMLSMGKTQQGGTLIKRPNAKLYATTKRPLTEVFNQDNGTYIHSHMIYTETLAERLAPHRHLFILRHPRNIAVSWMRHRITQDPSLVASSELLKHIVSGGMFGQPVPEFIGLHLGWQQDQATLTVRFEDLVARDIPTLQAIAQYVGAQPDPVHYDTAFGSGSTFTGSFSDWSENALWDDDVTQAWIDVGGLRIEALAGYLEEVTNES